MTPTRRTSLGRKHFPLGSAPSLWEALVKTSNRFTPRTCIHSLPSKIRKGKRALPPRSIHREALTATPPFGPDLQLQFSFRNLQLHPFPPLPSLPFGKRSSKPQTVSHRELASIRFPQKSEKGSAPPGLDTSSWPAISAQGCSARPVLCGYPAWWPPADSGREFFEKWPGGPHKFACSGRPDDRRDSAP